MNALSEAVIGLDDKMMAARKRFNEAGTPEEKRAAAIEWWGLNAQQEQLFEDDMRERGRWDETSAFFSNAAWARWMEKALAG